VARDAPVGAQLAEVVFEARRELQVGDAGLQVEPGVVVVHARQARRTGTSPATSHSALGAGSGAGTTWIATSAIGLPAGSKAVPPATSSAGRTCTTASGLVAVKVPSSVTAEPGNSGGLISSIKKLKPGGPG